MSSPKSNDEETNNEAMLQMDIEPITNVLTQANLEEEEPFAKRQRMESNETTLSKEDSIKMILLNMNRAICCRLDSMERKLTSLQNSCIKMSRKLDGLSLTMAKALTRIKDSESPIQTNGSPPNNTVVIGLPPEDEHKEPPSPQTPTVSQSISRNVTLITLNTEEDFPQGSWLGDESNVECRVRCGITPTDMLHIMQTSKTPEKCALKLLDYLFDRETQAMSNLSGTGKHGKRQLDPLMIYGLRCHLIKHFCITESEWHRIRLNIDSKCRTAFRRKQRGLPLMVKAFGYKMGTPESDNSLTDRYTFRQDTTGDCSAIQPQRVQVQMPVDDEQLNQIARDSSSPEPDTALISEVQIQQEGIKLHRGHQINITQTGEIQIAVVEENGTTETLVLHHNDPNQHQHSPSDPVVPVTLHEVKTTDDN